jgi:hypothetical protein
VNRRRFFKFFVAGLLFQLFLVFGGYTLLFGPFGEQKFRSFVLLSVYSPFIDWIMSAGGYSGESSMVWPPVFGVLLGIVTYSALFALTVTFLTKNRV